MAKVSKTPSKSLKNKLIVSEARGPNGDLLKTFECRPFSLKQRIKAKSYRATMASIWNMADAHERLERESELIDLLLGLISEVLVSVNGKELNDVELRRDVIGDHIGSVQNLLALVVDIETQTDPPIELDLADVHQAIQDMEHDAEGMYVITYPYKKDDKEKQRTVAIKEPTLSTFRKAMQMASKAPPHEQQTRMTLAFAAILITRVGSEKATATTDKTKFILDNMTLSEAEVIGRMCHTKANFGTFDFFEMYGIMPDTQEAEEDSFLVPLD